LDISLFYFANATAPGDRAMYHLLLEGARRADAAGLAAVWMPERHFHPFGGIYPNPAVTGAAVAAITHQIGIRAGSVVAPLHDPIRIAEEWAILDRLSHGRVGVSFASGWQPVDFALAPESYMQRKEIMVEAIDAVRRLWRGESLRRVDGKGNEVDIVLQPKPLQAELPVWVTSSGNPETFQAAGALRANLLTHLLGQDIDTLHEKVQLYRTEYAATGGGKGRVTLMLHSFLHEDDEIARTKARDPFIAYLKSSYDLVADWAQRAMPGFDPQDVKAEDLDFILSRAFDRYYDQSGLFGSLATALTTVDRFEEIGVDEIACLIDFGIDIDETLNSIDLIGELCQLLKRSPLLDTR